LLRRIATAALVVGSAAALLVGSSTYAPFTDEAQGSGGVQAGSVLVSINGTDAATFAFNTAQCSNMAPGHDCTESFTVDTGASTLSATWDVDVSDDDTALDGLPDGCFTETVSGLTAGNDESGDADDDHDPGDSQAGTLTVQVADDNRCQGAATDITVVVTATQSATPHN
jgi:predicted ribosomally synthesized peptide with SipW-like signal peptide